jgi:hypothetical protein
MTLFLQSESSGDTMEMTAATAADGTGSHTWHGSAEARTTVVKWDVVVTRTSDNFSDSASATLNVDAPPKVLSFSGAPVRKDTAGHPPDSLQVELGQQVLLTWTVQDAEGAELVMPDGDARVFGVDGPGGSAIVTPQQDTQDYILVAVASPYRSDPAVVHVSTHPPGQAYSGHAKVFVPKKP